MSYTQLFNPNYQRSIVPFTPGSGSGSFGRRGRSFARFAASAASRGLLRTVASEVASRGAAYLASRARRSLGGAIERARKRKAVDLGRKLQKYRKSNPPETPVTSVTNMASQGTGTRRRITKTVSAGRKRYNPMKVLKTQLGFVEQQLGVYNLINNAWASKHVVSEYNPGTGGSIPIALDSNATASDTAPLVRVTPMHVYDLNYVIGTKQKVDTTGGIYTDDSKVNWPVTSTIQNDDINSRVWYWNNSNKFTPLANNTTTRKFELRYYVNPDNLQHGQFSSPGVQHTGKVYRKGIDIRFMLYGTKKMATEFDVRVIRILDKEMCPDYESSLRDRNDAGVAIGDQAKVETFKSGWRNLVYHYTTNPLLKGVEPGCISTGKRWFQTVARKTIRVGEQTNDIESIPCAQGRIYVNLNEVANLAWQDKNWYTDDGPAAYDDTDVTGNGLNDAYSGGRINPKPYYTGRLYLLVRALSPRDCANNNGRDGANLTDPYPWMFDSDGLGSSAAAVDALDYAPSYDLSVRTTYMRMMT